MNNAHRQTLQMGGKILGASHRPELRKWNGNLCSSGLERKKWNTWEGRPFVPYNFQSNRAFHLHLNRLNRQSVEPEIPYMGQFLASRKSEKGKYIFVCRRVKSWSDATFFNENQDESTKPAEG